MQTDPYAADTDDDGIPDGKEVEFGTNPAATDTDGDGIADSEELAEDTDPTIHDYKGPDIDVFRANFGTSGGKTTYSLGYSADDPSGLATTAVVKGDEARFSEQFDDYPQAYGVGTQFQTGVLESTFDGMFGTTVTVQATDRHANTHQRVGMERSNFYGTLAGELGSMADEDTAGSLGLLSGFTAGMGGTARTIGAIADEPFGFLGVLGQLVEVMNQLGLLPKLLAAMPGQMVEDVKEKQDRNNPYDPATETSHYQTFETGYYLGYGVYFLASMVVGDYATKSIKSSSQFQKVVEKLDSNGRVTQANRYLDAAKGRTTEPVKKGGYKLGARAAKGSLHLGKASGRRIVSGAKTAGGQVRLYHQIRKIDGHKIDDLTPSQESRLRTVLAHTGDDGVEAIDGMDKETVERVLDMTPSCKRASVSASGFGGSCPGKDSVQDFQQSVFEAGERGDITYVEIDRVVRRIDTLDDKQRNQAIRFVAKTDTDGIKAISDLSDDELDVFISIIYKGDIDGEPSDLIDNRLTANDMLELTNKKIALDETMGVVKPNRPYESEKLDTIWLEKGRLDSAAGQKEWARDVGGAGWEHIRHNHVNKPTGNDFAQSLGPKYDDPAEVKKLIMESVRKGEPIIDDGDIIYRYEKDGKVISTVVGDNGFIVTSAAGDLTK